MLEYMHSMSLIYRDLKPENVMVNEHGIILFAMIGYLTLIDFGSAKLMGSQTNKRTKTIIGTPHYMAPEIIIGQSYSSAVDLWSLGVCMYEFISGGVPFGEDVEVFYSLEAGPLQHLRGDHKQIVAVSDVHKGSVGA
jgi:cGMP-dependent protein kinase